jgi:sulfur carrier protein
MTAARLSSDPKVVKVQANVYLTSMRVRLNGESRDIGDGITIADLVGQLGLGRRRIAVEVNRDIVPRDAYTAHALREGDEVEIVQFIGGG